MKADGYIAEKRICGGLNVSRSFGDFDYKDHKGLSYEHQMVTCKPEIQ